MALFSNLWGTDPYMRDGPEMRLVWDKSTSPWCLMRSLLRRILIHGKKDFVPGAPWEEGLCSWCFMGRRTRWSTRWPTLTSWQVERQQRCILVRSCFDLDLIISVSEYHLFLFLYHHKDLHPHPHHQCAQVKDGPEHSIVRIVMGRARWVKGTQLQQQ